MSRIGWRTALMAGAAAGLATSALVSSAALSWVVSVPAIAAGMLAATAVVAGSDSPHWGLRRLTSVGAVFCVAFMAGLVVGGMRVDAIDRSAPRPEPGAALRVTGTVESWSRDSSGSSVVVLSTRSGRMALQIGPETTPTVGSIVAASGTVRRPERWRIDWFRRNGVARVLEVRSMRDTGVRRGGLAGAVDRVRIRAEAALSEGLPPTEAALANGFVLGADQLIPPATIVEFRRSGLAHLLAVSGQNVILLSVLSWPLLALCGLRMNGRLVGTALLIALYVLVTGAGPSILRAGIMGVAGLVALISGRPATRAHALCLAAAATLALNPLSVNDPGWLLSFAATAGILLWSRPLARLLGRDGERAGPVRRAAADAIAVTGAATVATAPVGVAIFGTLSVVSLPANIVAAPAVAPVMWIGMLTAMLGQIPGVPVALLGSVTGPIVAYIEWVAHVFASPSQAMLSDLGLDGPLSGVALVLVTWLVAGAGIAISTSWAQRRRGLSSALAPGRRPGPMIAAGVGVVGLLLAVATTWSGPRPEPTNGLLVCALDVGQGDSILIDPPGGDPILVDTGPPGSGVAQLLADRGVERLSALVLTHDQSDHVGEAPSLLRSLPVGKLVHSGVGEEMRRLAVWVGTEPVRMFQGAKLPAAGGVRVVALWPPPSAQAASGDENESSLVLLVRWRHFTALLGADAEAEAVPVDPGPVDLLKVAHHGSRDAGLDNLLERTMPKLALISVGAGNPYGHPAAATLGSLSRHSVRTLRTDEDGSVGARVEEDGWSAVVC